MCENTRREDKRGGCTVQNGAHGYYLQNVSISSVIVEQFELKMLPLQHYRQYSFMEERKYAIKNTRGSDPNVSTIIAHIWACVSSSATGLSAVSGR